MYFLVFTVSISVLILTVPISIAQKDPCLTTDELPHLNERIVGYKLNANETPICDYYLDEQWYNLIEKYVIADSAKSCGTTYNWYLKDPLPITGTKNAAVCRNAGVGNTCSETKQIQIKKCSKGYVFRLQPLDGCSEAYCIQPIDPNVKGGNGPPDISSINPVINVEVVENRNGKASLEFYCDINPTANTNFQYVVEWSRHTGSSLTRSLLKTSPNYHQGQEDFRRKTALREHHLKSNNINNPGFTLGCTIKARDGSDGQYSSSRASFPKFFGIEVVNKTSVRLQDDEKKTVFLRLTVPFGCSSGDCFLDVNTFIPKKSETCFISRVAQTAREGIYCGVRFHRSDYKDGTLKPFTITATFGKSQVQQTQSVYDVVFSTGTKHGHVFFANYRAASVRIELNTNSTILKDKECYSRSDPHMMTFDGESYDNQRDGTFIMYRHTDLEVEVQTKTKRCTRWDHGTWKPWCNCAVAVRAGRDIYVIDLCTVGLIRPSGFVMCEDGVLSRKVKINGDTYKIFLPSGGVVDLVSDGQFINVLIKPSLVDYKKTEGLCGLFDNNKSNDRNIRPNSHEKDSSLSWKVKEAAGENLFDAANHKQLKHWKEDRYLCYCERDNGRAYTDPLNPEVKCDPTRKILCPDEKTMKEVKATCDLHVGRRRKRGVESPLTDFYTDAATEYVPTEGYRLDGHHQFSKPERTKRSTYSNVTAKTDCLKLMNTTAFQMCDKIPDLNFDSLITDCIADAVMTDSMDWTRMHLEAIKSRCIHHVDVLQPLPPDVLADLVEPERNDTNSSNMDSNNQTTTTRPISEIFSITPELLASIKSVSCPNECSGHGTCSNGTCECDEPFTSFDCSVNRTEPPVMFGIPDRGKCDLRKRACAETSVIGRNFAETKTLRCRLVPFVLDSGKNITVTAMVHTQGYFESLNEVYCPFRNGRDKRSTKGDITNDFISRGYRVSVSNDGVGFSDEDTIVIFDSKCVDCSKANGSIICTTKTGFCMTEGNCFSLGEASGCQICKQDNVIGMLWENGPECPHPIQSNEGGKLWIIGAVFGPLAFLSLIALAVFCWQKGKTPIHKVGSMTSMKRDADDFQPSS